jgi:hypothetical protein
MIHAVAFTTGSARSRPYRAPTPARQQQSSKREGSGTGPFAAPTSLEFIAPGLNVTEPPQRAKLNLRARGGTALGQKRENGNRLLLVRHGLIVPGLSSTSLSSLATARGRCLRACGVSYAIRQSLCGFVFRETRSTPDSGPRRRPGWLPARATCRLTQCSERRHQREPSFPYNLHCDRVR